MQFLLLVVLICAVVFAVVAHWHVAVLSFLFALVGTSLLFGAPWFWILCLLESGILFWCLDDDDYDGGGVATVSVLILLLLFQFFSNVKVFSYIGHHLWQAVVYVAGYFVIGAGWSVGKWWFAETKRFREVKERFFQSHGTSDRGTVQDLSEGDRQAWADMVKRHKTVPSMHKNRFLSWIGFWPWSFVWTMINDPFKRICRRIYYELEGVYQRITDHVWQS